MTITLRCFQAWKQWYSRWHDGYTVQLSMRLVDHLKTDICLFDAKARMSCPISAFPKVRADTCEIPIAPHQFQASSRKTTSHLPTSLLHTP